MLVTAKARTTSLWNSSCLEPFARKLDKVPSVFAFLTGGSFSCGSCEGHCTCYENKCKHTIECKSFTHTLITMGTWGAGAFSSSLGSLERRFTFCKCFVSQNLPLYMYPRQCCLRASPFATRCCAHKVQYSFPIEEKGCEYQKKCSYTTNLELVHCQGHLELGRYNLHQ